MEDDLQRFAVDLSLRFLAQQERAVEELRARTGTLLAASSLVASFLGAQAIGRVGLGVVGAAALLAFVASILASVFVLLPIGGLRFTPRVAAAFRSSSGDETYPLLLRSVEALRRANGRSVRRLQTAYLLGALALAAQLLLWVLQLSGIL